MGRPLYTTALLARYATEAIRTEPPKPTYPLVEKWSRWNAFDPDSDEFFHPDNAVYEAFLSEEEIAERAQMQQRESARLLAETLLRAEAEADTSSASSSTTADSDRPATGGERVATSRPAVQMEIDVQYDPLVGDTTTRLTRDSVDDAREGGTAEEQQPLRRQPRRSPAMFQWDDDSSRPADVAVPRISVVPVESSVGTARAPSRSPSPDPFNLVSGLNHLSESPRPLVPTESPERAVSPIPNTPARVSGVFTTPQPTETTLSPAPTMTPRILSWGSDVRGQWLPDSPTPAPRAVFRYMDARIPTTSAPLTY